MATNVITTQMVPLSRIFLNKENPRHEPVTAEAQAIDKLCTNENVLELARDIARHGTNPLEMAGLFPVSENKSVKDKQTFIVAEGNRRICALKLLTDPDLAPARLRKSFEKLSKSWSPITEIFATIFPTIKEARLWMERIHNGPQGGIGRKNWNSDQKTRFDGDSKNRVSLDILDYGEEMGFITNKERSRKLTTAQRFLGNDVFRETVGIDQSDADQLERTRPKAEFDTILRRFFRDLVEGDKVHSRQNKKEIIDYARTLNGLSGITSNRIDPEPLRTTGPNGKRVKSSRNNPRKPQKLRHIQHHDEIYQGLRSLGNEKLQALYHSICDVELEHHTPLICVGVWAFFETLTACAGRTDSVSFSAFLSKGKLSQLGVSGNGATLQSAMNRIAEYGNTTKHHPIAATFNGAQLNNDMNTLKEVILRVIAEAIKQVP